MHTASLLVSMLFGAVGMGYCIYGKRQQEIVALASGAMLCIYPFFVSRVIWMVLIGLVLSAAPFVIDI